MNIVQITPSTLQNILNTINQAQTALASAINLVAAVKSDLEAPLNVLRQTAIFTKGLAGLAYTVADLPTQLVKDYQSSVTQSLNILSSSIPSTVTDPTTLKALAAITAGIPPVEGVSYNAVQGGQLGPIAQNLSTNNPSNNVFFSPDAFFTLMNQVPLSTLALTTTQQTQVSNAIAQYSELTVADLSNNIDQ